MWLTSKSPARVRTARCSSVMPEYSTGMPLRAISAIRAHGGGWVALGGVFWSGAGELADMPGGDWPPDDRDRTGEPLQTYYPARRTVKAAHRRSLRELWRARPESFA